MSNWMDVLANPQGHMIGKFLSDMLQERYGKHIEVTERISRNLVTKGDIDKFGKLVMDIYEAGYVKAIGDHREALQQIGVKVQIKPQEQPSKAKKIFEDQPT